MKHSMGQELSDEDFANIERFAQQVRGGIARCSLCKLGSTFSTCGLSYILYTLHICDWYSTWFFHAIAAVAAR